MEDGGLAFHGQGIKHVRAHWKAESTVRGSREDWKCSQQ